MKVQSSKERFISIACIVCREDVEYTLVSKRRAYGKDEYRWQTNFVCVMIAKRQI
jgi:hypothetical protein